MTEALVTTLDPQQAAARLCELVVPALADWAVVALNSDAGRLELRRGLEPACTRHRDADLQPLAEHYAHIRSDALVDDSLLRRVVRTGRPELVRGNATETLKAMFRPGPTHDLLTALAPEHLMLLPLLGRQGAIGVLSLKNGAERGPFHATDLAAAADIAARAGLVLDNARLYNAQRSLTEALQRSLLTTPPSIDGLQIAVRYTPAAQAAEIGGDWYDCFAQGPDATFVIGDVAGHDIDAAAAMGQVRTLLRGIAVATQAGPAVLLDAVDTALVQLRVTTLATAVAARLAPPAPGEHAWDVRWANAGHPPPMLVHPDGRVEVLHTGPELLLGVASGVRRSEFAATLPPGSLLLLYTDGLIETRERSIDDGIELLRRTLAELGAPGGSPVALDDLCDGLLTHLLTTHPEDDVALLAVRPLP